MVTPFRPTIRSSHQGATVDFANVMKNFDGVIDSMKLQGADVIYDALLPTFAQSQVMVPVDTGALKSSGFLIKEPVPNGAEVVIGYAENGEPPYAVAVHEDLEAHHEPPTQAKFLQRPLEENAIVIENMILIGFKVASGIDPVYVHFSSEPLTEVESMPHRDIGGQKTPGLWLSSGNAWPKAVQEFGIYAEPLAHATQVEFAPGANILHISNAAELDAFTAKYGREGGRSIDWGAVRSQHSGLVIDPYIAERRGTDSFWYNTWDLASGVVWDKSAIGSLTPLRKK